LDWISETKGSQELFRPEVNVFLKVEMAGFEVGSGSEPAVEMAGFGSSF
jgi:hypothetical protein